MQNISDLVLRAAGLRSLKILRDVLREHTRQLRKARRDCRKRARDDGDGELDSAGSKKKKRSRRKAERRRSGKREASSSKETEDGFATGIDERPRKASRTDKEDPLPRSRPGHEDDPKRRGSSDIREGVRRLVNSRTADGVSALHRACSSGSVEVVKYLISKGADVNVRSSNGDTPMHVSLAPGLRSPSLIALLRECGADMEARNDQGLTPSDILFMEETRSQRAKNFVDEQAWQSHLAEEVSDDEETWWGVDVEWGEDQEQHWDDDLLERKAEHSQRRGLYDEPFNIRDYLKTEKGKTQSERPAGTPTKMGEPERKVKHESRRGPGIVGPQPLKVSRGVRSYGQRWTAFVESCDICLSYASVPFPVKEGEEESLADVLLRGVDPSLHKAALRSEMLKWHPDKFLQKWEAKVRGPDHDRIVARVNWTSEAIHTIYKNLKPLK